MVAILQLKLEINLVGLRQAKVHLLILMLIYDVVPLSFIIVLLVILELSKGIDRVFR